jgi:hypothetical protein
MIVTGREVEAGYYDKVFQKYFSPKQQKPIAGRTKYFSIHNTYSLCNKKYGYSMEYLRIPLPLPMAGTIASFVISLT